MIEQIVYDISQRYEAMNKLKQEVNDRIGYCNTLCRANDISSSEIYTDKDDLKNHVYNGDISDSWQFAMQQSQELVSYISEYQTLLRLENIYSEFNSGKKILTRDIGVEHQEVISSNNKIVLDSYDMIDPSHMNRITYESIFNRLQGVSSLIDAKFLHEVTQWKIIQAGSGGKDNSPNPLLELSYLQHYQDKINYLQEEFESEIIMFKSFLSSRGKLIKILNNETFSKVLMLFFGYLGWIFSPKRFFYEILGIFAAIIVQIIFLMIIESILKSSIKARGDKVKKFEDSTNELQSNLRDERQKDIDLLLNHHRWVRDFKKLLENSKELVQFIKV